MSSICRGFALCSPRSVFTVTGKKQRTAAIAIFDCAVIGLNQAPKIGANAMIGTAFAAMKIGISALPTVRKRLTIVAATIPRPEPIAKPPSASLNVYQPAGQSEWRCVQNTLTIVLGFG